jgi:uncharacterized membrane protein
MSEKPTESDKPKGIVDKTKEWLDSFGKVQALLIAFVGGGANTLFCSLTTSRTVWWYIIACSLLFGVVSYLIIERLYKNVAKAIRSKRAVVFCLMASFFTLATFLIIDVTGPVWANYSEIAEDVREFLLTKPSVCNLLVGIGAGLSTGNFIAAITVLSKKLDKNYHELSGKT